MADPVPRRITAEEWERIDFGIGPRAELIDGELVWPNGPPGAMMPRGRHGRVQARLCSALSLADGPEPDDSGWWILIEPSTRLELHVVVEPDIAGWRRTRLPELPDGSIDVVPDWTCEVLSPTHEAHDRVRKRELYLRHGVGWYWIVDAAERTLEAYENSTGRWLQLGAWTDGAVVRIAPFEEIEIAIGTLFHPLRR